MKQQDFRAMNIAEQQQWLDDYRTDEYLEWLRDHNDPRLSKLAKGIPLKQAEHLYRTYITKGRIKSKSNWRKLNDV